MEHDAIEALRDKHPAWRLLRAQNAPLILGFLGQHFVENNAGATSASDLTTLLDEYLYALDPAQDKDAQDEDARYPRQPGEYLELWSGTDAGWLRRFYPTTSDEVHYDATSELEKAYAWVAGLAIRPFVGTESRLHTVVNLLREIVHGTETDPQVRLATLKAQRDELDQQIAAVEAGEVDVLGDTAVRDRYQQFARTARELLADFREVEENFRALDRGARERIASWDGAKGELLADLVATRSDISGSDQGTSFQAFYDFLLSEARQDELSELLGHVQSMEMVTPEVRMRTIHHDWAEAAERTQGTVRQISEQLRRFLDDRVWLENKRVLDLVRSIEATALACRNLPPAEGMTLDVPGIPITLPLERPLHDAKPAAEVDSMLGPTPDEELDVSDLLTQTYIDTARLADNLRTLVPPRGSMLLADVVEFYPIQHGAAEVIGYLSLNDDELTVTIDENAENLSTIDYQDDGRHRRIRMPMATVSRA